MLLNSFHYLFWYVLLVVAKHNIQNRHTGPVSWSLSWGGPPYLRSQQEWIGPQSAHEVLVVSLLDPFCCSVCKLSSCCFCPCHFSLPDLYRPWVGLLCVLLLGGGLQDGRMYGGSIHGSGEGVLSLLLMAPLIFGHLVGSNVTGAHPTSSGHGL